MMLLKSSTLVSLIAIAFNAQDVVMGFSLPISLYSRSLGQRLIKRQLNTTNSTNPANASTNGTARRRCKRKKVVVIAAGSSTSASSSTVAGSTPTSSPVTSTTTSSGPTAPSTTRTSTTTTPNPQPTNPPPRPSPTTQYQPATPPSSPSPPPPPPPPPPAANFAGKCLALHNRARQEQGLVPYTLTAELTKSAEDWSNNMGRRNVFEHSGGKYGENIYMGPNSNIGECASIFKAWYDDEKPKYNGQPIGDGDFHGYGHFTQIIWPSSTQLGCGEANHHGRQWVTCQYNPPGNVKGQRLTVK